MVERIIRGMAGFMILATLLLAYYHSSYWLWVTAFVGANLFAVIHDRLVPGHDLPQKDRRQRLAGFPANEGAGCSKMVRCQARKREKIEAYSLYARVFPS